MTYVTHSVTHCEIPAQSAPTVAVSMPSAFSVFTLALSFVLLLLGMVSVEYPQPDAATGDPFLFLLRR